MGLFLVFAFLSKAQKEVQTMPSIVLKDMDGKSKNVAEYSQSGKITIISFWATWCSPCKKELNNMHELYDEWKEKYDLNPVAIGNIFGVIGVFSAVVQGGLIGVFQKKLGLRKMLIWGAPIAGIGLSLIPLPSKEWFYAVQFFAIFCLALANGLLMPAINSLVSLNAPANAQGQMLGIMQSLGSLARAVGPLLSGLLYAQFYMLPYLAGGILMMINFGLALILAKQLNQSPQEVVKD